ncbi:MAG: hypothetical protein WBN39_15895, partial [Flavobacteriaceae bacterium]
MFVFKLSLDAIGGKAQRLKSGFTTAIHRFTTKKSYEIPKSLILSYIIITKTKSTQMKNALLI